jgi:hypothetical protein
MYISRPSHFHSKPVFQLKRSTKKLGKNRHESRRQHKDVCWQTSVGDPRHLGTDLDPRIHSADWRIRIRIRLWIQILLFFVSVLQLNFFLLHFFICYCLKLHLHHFSMIKSHTEIIKWEKWRFFLLFLLNDRRIRSRIRNSY